VFEKGDTTKTDSRQLKDESKWKSNPLPNPSDMHKIETLIDKSNSGLHGMRVYNKSGAVIFTTGNYIENNNFRTSTDAQLVAFELAAGERIIGIRSHDCGNGGAFHFNV
jgi:hypothetical protein